VHDLSVSALALVWLLATQLDGPDIMGMCGRAEKYIDFLLPGWVERYGKGLSCKI